MVETEEFIKLHSHDTSNSGGSYNELLNIIINLKNSIQFDHFPTIIDVFDLNQDPQSIFVTKLNSHRTEVLKKKMKNITKQNTKEIKRSHAKNQEIYLINTFSASPFPP